MKWHLFPSQEFVKGLRTLSTEDYGMLSTTNYDLHAGDRDAALQLAAKGKEHAQLAKEARQAANQAAFESFNLHVTNRFKVMLVT